MTNDSILISFATVLLSLSCWTLYTLHGLAKQASAALEKEKAQDERIAENRARIMDVEEDVAHLQVKIAKAEGKADRR